MFCLFRVCLHCITCYSYKPTCVSLWGLRSYSITCVIFKVLYIGRENAGIDTCFVASLSTVKRCGMGRYEQIQMVVVWWHVFQWTKVVQPLYDKGIHRLLWAASRVGIGRIRGMRNQLNYCGWLPRFVDHVVNETAPWTGHLVHCTCHEPH
jgi:hypothetical protein